ncbi:hypothetical protein [Muribaculum intestinale]|uniref:hypothetical protein n=1 Tax=Muribaculum intestinale TaxID=1796646 RepID=UPI0025A94DCE|nr:hypothetical protein [Muribaculum intestinale]
MAKKKIKPSDLDLQPKQVGATENVANNGVVRTNDLHCPATQLDLCFTENTICIRSDYHLCDTDKDCKETIACPGTINCIDSRSAAIQCCAHTGSDCVESGNNCPGTDRTCGCIVYTDDCGVTRNNACPETFGCKSVDVCEISAVIEECPETIRNCNGETKKCFFTSNDCNESTDEDCNETNNCPIFTTTETFIGCQE